MFHDAAKDVTMTTWSLGAGSFISRFAFTIITGTLQHLNRESWTPVSIGFHPQHSRISMRKSRSVDSILLGLDLVIFGHYEGTPVTPHVLVANLELGVQ